MSIQIATAEVKALDDGDDPNGSFEVILSALSVDRDNEQFGAKAFDPLPEHINFDINHSMKAEDIVGSGTPAYDADGRLRVKGTWARTAKAQEIRSLVADGHLRTTSVTFRDAKKQAKAGGPTTITSAELLNGSFVVVPANRDALVLSAKAGARNSAKDQEHIQAAHDSTVAAGAMCAMKSAKAAPEADDDPGSLALAVDAALDALSSAMADAPEQVPDLLTAALAAVDALLAAMGLTDPDDTEGMSLSQSADSKDATGAGDVVDNLRLDLDLLLTRAGLDL